MDGHDGAPMAADGSDQDTLKPHGLIPSRPRRGSANQKPPHQAHIMQRVCAENSLSAHARLPRAAAAEQSYRQA